MTADAPSIKASGPGASAEKAWARLHTLNLSPTPELYTLFYSYYARRVIDVVKEVDALLADTSTGGFEPLHGNLETALLDIYDRHLNPSAEQAHLTNTSSQFELELRKIMETVENARHDTDTYGAALGGFTEQLHGDVGLEQLRYMISQMASETRQVAAQNAKLQQQLQSTSSQVSSLRTNLEAVRKESLSDPLTGVGNRKAFTADLTRLTGDAAAQQEPLTVLMIDIDHFKNFNDKHGHLVGDQVLRLVAHTLKENVKGQDTVARWGGEEFAILLPKTPLDAALKLADHLRGLMEKKKIIRRPQNEDLGAITLSMGVAQYLPSEDVSAFIDRADQALYRAKGAGRNRVMAADAGAVPDAPHRLAPVPHTASVTVAE